MTSVSQDDAFQAISMKSVINRLCLTFAFSKQDELNDFISLTFPQKLRNIVESDQFKPIWWNESGTSTVINGDPVFFPVFLPGKSHIQRSLIDYSPRGCK